jgi:uncharacterized lipoprotein YajG
MKYILCIYILLLAGCAYNETTICAVNSIIHCTSTTDKPVKLDGLNGNTIPISALP